MTIENLNEQNFISTCLSNAFEGQRGVNVSANKENTEVSEHEAGISIIDKATSRTLEIFHKGSKINPAIWVHRVQPLINFLLDAVKNIPEVEPLNCKIVINPHDNIMDGSPPDRNICTMGFSGPLPANTLFLPDPHYLEFLKNPIEDRADSMLFSEKKNQAFFRGSDTNIQRINLSLDTLNDPFYDCKISRFIPGAFEEKYLSIDRKKISSHWFNLDQQLNYRYILDPHGWTRGWDRAYWVLQSNSVLVSIIPDDGIIHHNWYSQFMYDSDIVPLITYEEACDPSTFKSFEEYNHKQKVFSNILMSSAVSSNYSSNLIVRYNQLFNS
tara:strand:+ start:2980 stop:3960 length:981 start_codon:yes stop_codon:yes gene_type:complete